MNQDNTKILVIAPPSISNNIVIGGMFLNSDCIRFVNSARNLGVILESDLMFNKQVKKVVTSCFMLLRKLYSIKHFLTPSQLKSLVCSKVFSLIDYCNSLYFGLNAATIKKLQHVQNCAARLIIKRGDPKPMEEFFLESHWLKVRERIIYKILLTVHKCLHDLAPVLLTELLEYAESDRWMKLRETKINSKFGMRAFSHVGPKLWNLLPHYIRSEHKTELFKKMIKSYLITSGDEFHRKINVH